MNHIGLAVDDVDAFASELQRNGVVMTKDPGNGADGNRGAWITDPDGNRIELMQMRPDCIQYQAVRRWHEQQLRLARPPLPNDGTFAGMRRSIHFLLVPESFDRIPARRHISTCSSLMSLDW